MALGGEALTMIESFEADARIRDALVAAAEVLVECWSGGGSLFLCGNGGSHADALHIAGELVKSFESPRPLPAELVAALQSSSAGPYAAELLGALQAGLPAFTLGANGSVSSAIANDIATPHIGLAQELSALGRRGDVLWALSTSGASRSVVLAATAARAIGITVIAFTGAPGPRNEVASRADVAVCAPATQTAEVQGWHVRMYHCLCGMVEAELFPGGTALRRSPR